MSMKPLGKKSYGSIPHLKGSRLGPAEHHVSPGQEIIATVKQRDKWDKVFVQEKLDGGNVGIAKVNGKILAITRAGYLAETSKYATHHAFKLFVDVNYSRFDEVLNEGERLCGEWLYTAVGTLYKLTHEPFVAFDLMRGNDRLNMFQLTERIGGKFVMPHLIGVGPLSIESALQALCPQVHGSTEDIEGVVWRVERKNTVDFLCKYVRPSKVDGKYLDLDLINEMPKEFDYLREGFAKIVQPADNRDQ